MANFISGIISLSISVVVLANIFIFVVKNQTCAIANESGGACRVAWQPAEAAMWGLLSLIGIVGMVYGVLAVFGIM